MADDSLGIYDEGCAFGNSPKAEHPVLPADLLLRIAEQRKGQAQLLRKTAVGLRLIDADAEYLGARAFETGKTILVCPELLRSARRVRKNVESQDNGALAPEIAEANHSARVVRQFKIWRRVSNAQCHPGFLLRTRAPPVAACHQ